MVDSGGNEWRNLRCAGSNADRVEAKIDRTDCFSGSLGQDFSPLMAFSGKKRARPDEFPIALG